MQSEGAGKGVPGSLPRKTMPPPVRPGLEFLLDAFGGAQLGESESNVFVLGGNNYPAVTFEEPRLSSGGGGGDTVLCRVKSGGTGFGSLEVEVLKLNRKTGNFEESGKQARLFLPETALGASIPKGTTIVGHRMMMVGYDS